MTHWLLSVFPFHRGHNPHSLVLPDPQWVPHLTKATARVYMSHLLLSAFPFHILRSLVSSLSYLQVHGLRCHKGHTPPLSAFHFTFGHKHRLLINFAARLHSFVILSSACVLLSFCLLLTFYCYFIYLLGSIVILYKACFLLSFFPLLSPYCHFMYFLCSTVILSAPCVILSCYPLLVFYCHFTYYFLPIVILSTS